MSEEKITVSFEFLRSLMLALIKLSEDHSNKTCCSCFDEKSQKTKFTVAERKDGEDVVFMDRARYFIFFLCEDCKNELRDHRVLKRKMKQDMNHFLQILTKRYIRDIPKRFDEIGFCYFLTFSHSKEIESTLDQSSTTIELLFKK